jgi:hypothetical protein
MKKLKIVILMLAIAGLSFYTYNYLYIVDGVELSRKNIVKKVRIDEFILIEYPDVFDHETTEDLKDYAKELINEIAAENNSKERLIVDKKIKYIQYNQVLVLENNKSYDLINHKFINDFEINDELKKILSINLRYQMKKNGDPVAYSFDIINTYYKNLEDYTVNINNEDIQIEYYDYHFEYPLINYADTLNYDLGINVKKIDKPEERYIDKNRKLVCLTYDDGPNYNDLDLLEILEKYDSKATFFQI